MQQLADITYFLPCLVSLMWLIIYAFRVKVFTQKVMMVVIALCVFYFVSYAFYILPGTDYQVMCILDMINVPVVLLLVSANLIYVYSHHSRALIESRWHLAFYAPVFIFSTVNFFLYYKVGFAGMARYFEAYDQYGAFPPQYDGTLFLFIDQFHRILHNVVLLSYILATLGFCLFLAIKNNYQPGNVWRFFFHHNASRPIRVICFLEFISLCLLMPLAGLGRIYLVQHPAMGALLSVLLSASLFLLFYVEYMVNLPKFTLSSLSHVVIGDMKSTSKSEPKQPGSGSEAIPAELLNLLRQAFEQDKVYLDPDLTLQKLATALSSNRTTLSAAVSQVYGVNFRQLVANYRIEAAKQYMLSHPDAKQDLVAMECGFATAQAFNQKFKEITGDSPRLWINNALTQTPLP